MRKTATAETNKSMHSKQDAESQEKQQIESHKYDENVSSTKCNEPEPSNNY